MDAQFNQIITLLEDIRDHLQRIAPLRKNRAPQHDQAVLDAADHMVRTFTLEQLKHCLPDDDMPSDKVIGSTLLHNGYRKIQLRLSDARHWCYQRISG